MKTVFSESNGRSRSPHHIQVGLCSWPPSDAGDGQDCPSYFDSRDERLHWPGITDGQMCPFHVGIAYWWSAVRGTGG